MNLNYLKMTKKIIEKVQILTSVAENFIGVSVPVKLDC